MEVQMEKLIIQYFCYILILIDHCYNFYYHFIDTLSVTLVCISIIGLGPWNDVPLSRIM